MPQDRAGFEDRADVRGDEDADFSERIERPESVGQARAACDVDRDKPVGKAEFLQRDDRLAAVGGTPAVQGQYQLSATS